MSSSYVWEINQQCARMWYGFARYMLLRPILMDARSGSLNPQWRDHLTLDALGSPPEAHLSDSNKLALLEIATMGVQAWEPYTGLGWRSALDSWYAAVLELEECRDRTRRPIRDDADVPPAVKKFRAVLAPSPLAAEQDARCRGSETVAGLDRGLVSGRFGRWWAGCGLARVVLRPYCHMDGRRQCA